MNDLIIPPSVSLFNFMGPSQGIFIQLVKKVASDSPRLVHFAIGLVIFVLNSLDGQVLLFGEIQICRRIVVSPANQKGFWG